MSSEVRYYQELTQAGQQLHLEEKKPPGTLCREELIVHTNVYGVGLPDVQVYRYDVDACGFLERNDRRVEFAKRAVDDVADTTRRNKCRAVVQLVCQNYANIFGNHREYFWYDSQSILFSKNMLDGIPEREKKEFVLTQEMLAGNPMFRGFKNVRLNIQRVSNSFAINIGDLTQYISADLEENDHSLQQFLEILTSQYAFNTPSEAICFGSRAAYLMQPDKHGFKAQDCADVGDGKYLGVGCSKSVRFIEGPRGDQRAGLVVDLKKTAFHYEQSLLAKSRAILNREPRGNDAGRLRQQLKGLVVETRHAQKPVRFTIEQVSDETPRNKKFMLQPDNREVTLLQYFQEKYNITLESPDSPIIVGDRLTKFAVFPLEACFVVDGQRVSMDQQTPTQIQKMIRACAVPPADRQRQILSLVQGLQLTSSNVYHQAAGITITEKPLLVRGRILPNPKIIYANNVVVSPDAQKATWRLDRQKPHYLIPAKIEKWAMYSIRAGGRSDVLDQPTLLRFAQTMVTECRMRGMQLGNPGEVSFIGCAQEEITATMEQAKKDGCTFCFFITNNDVTHIHQHMKLLERQTGVITQDLKMSSAVDVIQKNKRQTLENIINKTNMKNGGLNYTIRCEGLSNEQLLPSQRLIIGISTTHPKVAQTALEDRDRADKNEDPLTKKKPHHEKHHRSEHITPSVVGFAANFKKDPIEFIGDCLYQYPSVTRRSA
ncbi:hypothetical protein L596_018742 [Steinernema carpocapsae]|uniref:PAZ domain-containing protein n=1 Tax=Steinernema carpocapsae TaxID=34508 RepID=A0A4U5N630_STECR|nr:hypothetical protein L596_018742 [Steinernema carpocapsae]